ncbi:ER lumen protein retaining receptor family protein [Actinidia rufa]|uniref:ER lumen protein retaining receptor family protein n=1 Tax=Actinidia rufa TaxID=165716 RepID=A0A7J0HB81_9ERIC|nr:ER lumen protein retaining receptor family protein [Actinidia rufa]
MAICLRLPQLVVKPRDSNAMNSCSGDEVVMIVDDDALQKHRSHGSPDDEESLHLQRLSADPRRPTPGTTSPRSCVSYGFHREKTEE